jgi:hypothetical protein
MSVTVDSAAPAFAGLLVASQRTGDADLGVAQDELGQGDVEGDGVVGVMREHNLEGAHRRSG